MKKIILLMLVLTIVFPFAVFSGGSKEKKDAVPMEEAEPVEEYSYEKLVELAKAEGELVVYDTSSKIVPIGKAFQEKYGITVKATKMKNPEQVERVKREVDAGNIQVDVVGLSDGPIIVNELIPQGYLENWIPPDFKNRIPKEFHYPLTYRVGQKTFGYNFESYEKSPVTNIWQLTEPEWKGRVFTNDPAANPTLLGFFVAMTKAENAEKLEKAYEEYYGEKIKLEEENAGWEFLLRLFRNNPVIMKSDGDVAEAVGAPGQAKAPIGFYTYAKQRGNDDGLKLAVAFDIAPFIGFASGTYANPVKGCAHPNAAKLFVRFLLTEEGIKPHMKKIGVYSPNPDIPVHKDDDLGSWESWSKYMIVLDDELTWKIGQDVLDLWLITVGK